MKLLFELSQEHATLPHAEVLSCLQAENIAYTILDSPEHVLLVTSDTGYDTIQRLSERLSFTFYIDEVLFSCRASINELQKCAEGNPIHGDGSIAVHCKNRSDTLDSQQIVKTLGSIYSKKRTVDLTNPDFQIRVLTTHSTIYVGLQQAELDRTQFEKRKVHQRPFFSPISLHPKVARALVNLSQVRNGETLLDPFCGTGGILLEAGLLGARIIGSDVENKMIEGCTKTLDYYKLKNYELYCSDIGSIGDFVADIDAVATDMPYGRSTTTKGENILQLYTRAFAAIYDVLKKGRRAVVGLSNKDMIPLGENYFSLVEKHTFRVHRSLTRYFAVYQK
jgi:tRNA (guanine10-N2)-dimethyltransferase